MTKTNYIPIAIIGVILVALFYAFGNGMLGSIAGVSKGNMEINGQVAEVSFSQFTLNGQTIFHIFKSGTVENGYYEKASLDVVIEPVSRYMNLKTMLYSTDWDGYIVGSSIPTTCANTGKTAIRGFVAGDGSNYETTYSVKIIKNGQQVGNTETFTIGGATASADSHTFEAGNIQIQNLGNLGGNQVPSGTGDIMVLYDSEKGSTSVRSLNYMNTQVLSTCNHHGIYLNCVPGFCDYNGQLRYLIGNLDPTVSGWGNLESRLVAKWDGNSQNALKFSVSDTNSPNIPFMVIAVPITFGELVPVQSNADVRATSEAKATLTSATTAKVCVEAKNMKDTAGTVIATGESDIGTFDQAGGSTIPFNANEQKTICLGLTASVAIDQAKLAHTTICLKNNAVLGQTSANTDCKTATIELGQDAWKKQQGGGDVGGQEDNTNLYILGGIVVLAGAVIIWRRTQ